MKQKEALNSLENIRKMAIKANKIKGVKTKRKNSSSELFRAVRLLLKK